MTVDLIDRYLRKVSIWMPSRHRRRLLDALREDIAEQLGESPTPQEVQGVLRRFGPPALVAARYLRMRPVIDGMLAPTYYVVLGLSLLVGAIVHASMLIPNAVHDIPVAESLGAVATNALQGLLVTYAIVTLVFSVSSHVLATRRHAGSANAACGQ
jgi:hypothetical protein